MAASREKTEVSQTCTGPLSTIQALFKRFKESQRRAKMGETGRAVSERLRKSPQYYCRQTVEFLKHKIRSFAAQYHLRTAHMDFEVVQRISHASLFVRFIFQSSARIFFRMPTYP